MMEEAVMEAVPECEVGVRRERRMRRERGMRGKGPASETGATEARAGAHGAEMRATDHSATHGMHSHPATAKAGGMATTAPTKAGGMATTAPTKTTTTEATTASTSRERWRRKSERRTKRTRNETTEKLAIHPILHRSELLRDCYRRNQ
jgi:hypothetical protein